MSSTNRVLGIVSGFDTETLVKQLMDAENIKLDKLEKQKQYTEWEQEAYQDIVSMLTEFKSSYFDVLSSANNITSPTFFAEFTNSVLQNGVDSSLVSIRPNADIEATAHTIESISQLATKDKWTGYESGIRGITSSEFSYSDFITTIGSEDLEFNLSISGITKSISISNDTISGFTKVSDLVDELNNVIKNEFGDNYDSIVSLSGDQLHFDMAGNSLTIVEGDSPLSLDALGITNGQSSGDYKSKSISDLFSLSSEDLANFEINGISISISEEDTIAEVATKINSSDAGVTIRFNSLQDRFELTSNSEGSANDINIEDGSSAENFFATIFGVADLVNVSGDVVDNNIRVSGQNAILSLDGTEIIKDSNTFSQDGMTYTLNGTTDNEININVKVDASKIVDKIKEFVTDYNNILDHINTKLSEKKYYDYEPLTADEKEALSDDEVKLWEEKAKSGVLRGATELNAMLVSFKNSFVDNVKNAGISLSQIGISTSSYTDKGKLTVNEEVLTNAIESNYEDVVNLFSNTSDYEYLDGSNRSARYSENGVGNRIQDILKDYIRTTRDTGGNKGILIEKVGIENDSSYYSNFILDKINDYDDRIADMMDLLADKENHYYTMFASMESALSEMQSQYDSLFSSLGSSQ